MSSLMGPFAIPLCLAAACWTAVAACGGAGAAKACLSPGDAAEAVGARRVVAPEQALGQARRAVPGADVLRASLCGAAEALVYRIMVLRPDGRLVHVTVDAPSGKVTAIR